MSNSRTKLPPLKGPDRIINTQGPFPGLALNLKLASFIEIGFDCLKSGLGNCQLLKMQPFEFVCGITLLHSLTTVLHSYFFEIVHGIELWMKTAKI
jgi:hypothetical protein